LAARMDTGRVRHHLLLLPVALFLAAGGCGGDDASEDETDRAVAAAMEAFDEAQVSGAELADGPCIAEELPDLPDWVADIAHDPRESVDDEAANQCQRYREGDAEHFVELTPEGELIRAE
jgi:hypothetical protein